MKTTVPETLPGAPKIARTVQGVLFLLGIALLLLAAFSARSGWNKLHLSREQTTLPVKLEAGREFRAPFTTSGRHDLEIAFALSCHAGVSDEIIDEMMMLETNALNIAWAVQQNGMVIASGNVTNRLFTTGGAAERTRGVGRFRPRRSGTYELVAKVNSTRTDLDSARPRIMIQPNRAALMNASVGGSIGLFGGFVLGMIGLILILLARREHKSVTGSG